MVWTIKFKAVAQKQLAKIDKPRAKKILKFLRERVAKSTDPRSSGKPLRGDKSGLWRYRVNDYRIVCDIQDQELIVMILRLGHRKHVYD